MSRLTVTVYISVVSMAVETVGGHLTLKGGGERGRGRCRERGREVRVHPLHIGWWG